MNPGWRVTATTLYCEAVGEDVTIMMYGDGKVKCTGLKKFVSGATRDAGRLLKQRTRLAGREKRCLSPAPCPMTQCLETEPKVA